MIKVIRKINITNKKTITMTVTKTIAVIESLLTFTLREGCGKSKWKFKMAFAMKRGGVSRGSRVPHTYFEK